MKNLLKLIFSILLFAIVYVSFNYNIPYSALICNEAEYYINHNSDIHYITKNAVNNAKTIIKYATSGAGE